MIAIGLTATSAQAQADGEVSSVRLNRDLVEAADPSAAVVPVAQDSPDERVEELVDAVGLSAAAAEEPTSALVVAEAWILSVEELVDETRARVSEVTSKRDERRGTLDELEFRLGLIDSAIDDDDALTETVVSLRNEVPELETMIAAQQALLHILEETTEVAERDHAHALEALMIAWNLRSELASELAAAPSTSGGTGDTTAWATGFDAFVAQRLNGAQQSVANLPDLVQPPLVLIPDADRSSDTGMRWPLIGAVSSGFGMRIHPVWGGYRHHAGIDIDGDAGADLASADDGVVLKAERQGGYGNVVVIDHGKGITTLYGHMAEIHVSAGDRVQRGEIIGLVGSTGTATGPHLHFEVRIDDEGVDPLAWLP